MIEPTKQEIHDFLIDLRDSGVVNMWGAAPYLERQFGLTQREASKALIEWIADMTENKR